VPRRPTFAKPQPLGELALIAAIRQRTSAKSHRQIRLGIGDDCAILTPPPRHELLVTTDFSLEGRHFRRDWHSASSAGHRTLARGLSDLAAMGATPLAAFLSLALPRSIARNPAWIKDFLDSLLTLANTHEVPLAGGDTSESPVATNGESHILADIILLGSAPTGRALRRSTARPGDRIYVTGTLGGAVTELAALQASPRKFRNAIATDDHPHLFPQPRLNVGQALLRRRIATACIDLSDGISTDLTHICTESRVSAEIFSTQIPLHPLAHVLSPAQALHNALHGGEDYELLFTARPATTVPRSIAGVPVSPIGVITANGKKHAPRVTLVEATGARTPLAPGGWQHLT
jgi:thiamine-monophosphate kinase